MSGKFDKRPPKVFISYAHGSNEENEWVVTLAHRLQADFGIKVIFDNWDLKPGQDAYQFMEKMVVDPSIDSVIVLCDEKYRDKADGRRRSSGVGTESQIMSQEIYSNVEQTKFIPVIRSLDSEGKAPVPVFVKGRIYIDLSDVTTFEESLETLIRHIWNEPLLQEPEIGKKPSFLTEKKKIFKTQHLLKKALSHIENDSRMQHQFTQNTLETIIEEILEEKVDEKRNNYEHFDEVITSGIKRLQPLVHAFVGLTNLYSSLDEDRFFETYEGFIESLFALTVPRKTHYYEKEFDHYRFIRYQIFLCLISLLFKNKRYKLVNDIVCHKYYYEKHSQLIEGEVIELSGNIETLNHDLNKRLHSDRRNSVVADEIKKLSEFKVISFNDIMDSETILLILTSIDSNLSWPWYPQTLVYRNWRFGNLPLLLQRMQSRRYLQKLFPMFGCKNLEEFNERISVAVESSKQDGFSSSFWLPKFHQIIKSAKIGSKH